MMASKLPSSAVLAVLNSTHFSNGFNGLRSAIEQLAKPQPAFPDPLDSGYIKFLSCMAMQIDTAIETAIKEDTLSTL
jgi:hypothetical protein